MRVVPQWLDTTVGPLAAWRHEPPSRATVGLVLSHGVSSDGAFGHPAIRQLADAAATAGALVLRFEPPATGDSVGDPFETDMARGWRDGFAAAARQLRDAGVTRVVVGGARLAALAALVAADEAGADDVFGWAMPASGRAYFRELQALAAFGGASPGPARVATDARLEGSNEGGGQLFAAATVKAIGAWKAREATVGAGHRVLLVPRDDVPDDDTLATDLRARGLDVVREPWAGFSDAHAVPENRVVPADVATGLVRWMGLDPFPIAPAATPLVADGAAHRVRDLAGRVVTEQVVRIGPRPLTAVIGSPEATGVPAVLFLNAGVIGHQGPHRLWVELARAFTADGLFTCRLDLGGTGESPPPTGESWNVPYPHWATADVRDAVAWLRNRGHAHVTLVGLCSGAHNAFHAALAEPAIASVVLLNPITFYWRRGDPLDPTAWMTVTEYRRYARRFRELDAWKKLLRGGVDPRGVARVVARRTLDVLGGVLRRPAPDRATEAPAPRNPGNERRGDLAADLATLSKRGTAVTLVFGADEPGLDYARRFGGRAFRRLVESQQVHLDVADGSDHTFTRWGWRRWAHDRVTEAVRRSLPG